MDEQNAYEVWGVVDLRAGGPADEGTECEQVQPQTGTAPHFYSVYQHTIGEGCMVVDDYPTRDEARAAAKALSTANGLPVLDFADWELPAPARTIAALGPDGLMHEIGVPEAQGAGR